MVQINYEKWEIGCQMSVQCETGANLTVHKYANWNIARNALTTKCWSWKYSNSNYQKLLSEFSVLETFQMMVLWVWSVNRLCKTLLKGEVTPKTPFLHRMASYLSDITAAYFTSVPTPSLWSKTHTVSKVVMMEISKAHNIIRLVKNIERYLDWMKNLLNGSQQWL